MTLYYKNKPIKYAYFSVWCGYVLINCTFLNKVSNLNIRQRAPDG